MRRVTVTLTGIVQGVGFRPFVYRLAREHGVRGIVRNSSRGVEIDAEGDNGAVARFLQAVQTEHPPLALILDWKETEEPPVGYRDFRIETSERAEERRAVVPPDIATCDDCLREVFDPTNRRYLYPFTNCTNCGPRFTITRDIPYDRVNTSMAVFPMCPNCQAEYDSPEDRRFHAQPNACPECGPQLEVWDAEGRPVRGVREPIAFVAERLRAGKIVAIKGLGGFHLAVDALNQEAVVRLRRRKLREEKPLALMVPSLEVARRLVRVPPEAERILTSPRRPIVLLPKQPDCPVADAVAPGNPSLGIMLPYTPLHHILLRLGFVALVMTSANLSEEPICVDNREAVARLQGIADVLLVHNRDILVRCDDSVVRALLGGDGMLVRRSRGYVPQPVVLPWKLPAVLAVGAELKNTVCVLHGDRATLSQHIGDLENAETLTFFEEAVDHLQRILDVRPRAVAHDLHPDYLSTTWAHQQAFEHRVGVQHHHAHVAACLAEHGEEGLVLGVVLDGTGFGEDGTIWGGEILLADVRHYRRLARFRPVRMPGGEVAIREPWRMTLAYLEAAGEIGRARALLERWGQRALAVRNMLQANVNAPWTSSCGRLFDAVAAAAGLRERVTYEGQAAMELEWALHRALGDAVVDGGGGPAGGYPFALRRAGTLVELDWAPMWRELLRDLAAGVSAAGISLRFHAGLVQALGDLLVRLRTETGLSTVALSGGCFQNVFLLESLYRRLRERGFRVLKHRLVPPNDGGVALGQAVVAGMRIAAQLGSASFSSRKEA